MAEIWYKGIFEEDFKEVEHKQFGLPKKNCISLIDLRPKHWVCELNEFPKLKTGNSLVDESGYIYVFIRITKEEIDSDREGIIVMDAINCRIQLLKLRIFLKKLI